MSQEEHAALIDAILVEITAWPEVMAWKHATGVGVTAGRRIVRFGLKGSGDIIGSCAGRAFAIDGKTGKAVQKPHQIAFERKWTKAGGLYVLARSVDDVAAALRPLIRRVAA